MLHRSNIDGQTENQRNPGSIPHQNGHLWPLAIYKPRYAVTRLLCRTTGLPFPWIESAKPLSELASASHWPLPNSTPQPLDCYNSDRNSAPLSGRNRHSVKLALSASLRDERIASFLYCRSSSWVRREGASCHALRNCRHSRSKFRVLEKTLRWPNPPESEKKRGKKHVGKAGNVRKHVWHGPATPEQQG